jgi:hypothetical protein
LRQRCGRSFCGFVDTLDGCQNHSLASIALKSSQVRQKTFKIVDSYRENSTNPPRTFHQSAKSSIARVQEPQKTIFSFHLFIQLNVNYDKNQAELISRLITGTMTSNLSKSRKLFFCFFALFFFLSSKKPCSVR